MEVLTSARTSSNQRDLKAVIVERVRAKTLAQLQAARDQQLERDRLLSLAAERSRTGTWRPSAPSYDEDDDSHRCSTLVRRIPVLLLIFVSCSIVIALLGSWLPIAVGKLLVRKEPPPVPRLAVEELAPAVEQPPSPEQSPPPAPKQSCPALFDGEGCRKHKPLPRCMDGVYRGYMTLGNWIDSDLGDDQHLANEIIGLMPSEVRLPTELGSFAKESSTLQRRQVTPSFLGSRRTSSGESPEASKSCPLARWCRTGPS